MKNIVYLIPFLFLISCSTLREIPVQTIEKIEYKDSTVFIHDTLKIKVPVETVKEIVPQDTVSQIATSLAFSEAKIERGMLYHTLEQKGEIKTVYDTIVTVEYVDRIIEKEVPVITEVEKPFIPTFFWLVFVYACVITVIGILKLYLKFKKI